MKKQTFKTLTYNAAKVDTVETAEGYLLPEKIGGAEFFISKNKGRAKSWTVSEVSSGMAIKKGYKARTLKDAARQGAETVAFALKTFGQEKFSGAIEKGCERMKAAEIRAAGE